MRAVRPFASRLLRPGPLVPGSGSAAGCAYLGALDAVERYPDTLLATDNDRLGTDRFPRERFASIVDADVFIARTARIGAAACSIPGASWVPERSSATSCSAWPVPCESR